MVKQIIRIIKLKKYCAHTFNDYLEYIEELIDEDLSNGISNESEEQC